MRAFRRAYGLALRMLPAWFRAAHGAQARRLAAARVREETGLRRPLRAGRELLDLVASAPRLHRLTTSPPAAHSEGRAMGSWWTDVRTAMRSLWRSRGFTAIAVATLGAAIALGVTVMAAVNAYLVRGLPYPEADRLYSVRFTQPNGPFFEGLDRIDWTRLDDVFEHGISWDLDMFTLRGAPYAEAVQGSWVTPGYMAGYGIRPARGRAFEAGDYVPGSPSVAIISHRLWQTRFDGAFDVVGRRFEAFMSDRPDDAETFTVVGVLPADFWHLNAFTDVLAPLRGPSYPYMARLAPGVSPALAVERVTALVGSSPIPRPDGWRVELVSTHAAYVEQIRPLLVALSVATALVLLIACANVAVLSTVRATARRREVAVRKALGASAGRVARALAAEAVILGAASTVVGLAAAWGLVAAAAPALQQQLGRPAPGGVAALRLDGLAIATGLAAGVLVVLLCAAVQWLTSRRAPLALSSGGSQKGATAGPGQRRAHAALIAVEVAVCLTLLVGAALMIQSGLRILAVDMGLDTRNVMVGRLNLNPRVYPDAAARLAFFERAAEGAAALPGRAALAFTNAWPLQATLPRAVRREDAETTAAARAGLVTVSASYFDLLGIDVVDGRVFTAADRIGAEPVAVVSRTLAARLWPDGRAVGRRFVLSPPQGAPPGTPSVTRLVVGVVGDIRHAHTDEDVLDAYVPLAQAPSSFAFAYVRSTADPGEIERGLRALVAGIDPDLAMSAPQALDRILDRQRASARLLASLLMVFSAFAAALALVGIYGVVAYTVREREQEIAVRLAIGAGRAAIVTLFVRQGAWVLAAGLAIGIVGAVLLSRVLETQLFGVRAADPIAIALVTVALAACGLAAIAWPARRAAATDPALALKT